MEARIDEPAPLEIAGTGLFITSYIVRPALAPPKTRATASSMGVGVGLGQVVVGGRF